MIFSTSIVLGRRNIDNRPYDLFDRFIQSIINLDTMIQVISISKNTNYYKKDHDRNLLEKI